MCSLNNHRHSYRRLATYLAWALVATGCQQPRTTLKAPGTNRAEIDGLISGLDDPQQDWAASAQLQKLGEPATAALVAHLRQDPFADDRHGNHSPTMKVLEKIGEPSLPVLAAALTPSLLQSEKTDDLQYVRSAILVMARINRGRAAENLIRIARSETNLNLRAEALDALLGPEKYPDTLSRTSRWEPCFNADRAPCPTDPEAASMATILRPMQPEISALLKEAPTPGIRLASAHILARWGADDFKNQGEHQLTALVMTEPLSVRKQAIQALGILQVPSSSVVLKKQIAGSNEELKRTIAEALFRLNDPGYFAVVCELMSSRQEDTRRWSIRLARDSHNLSFVPRLIDRLQDTGWNGTTTTTQSAGQGETVLRHTLKEDALEALARLTFENLGPNAEPWRRWWKANGTTSWESLLGQLVGDRLTEISHSEPYTTNQWMGELDEASNPAVLPFVEAFLHHARLDLSRIGPNLYSGGGGPPLVLPLLLELVNQNSVAARQLLYGCLAAKDLALRQYCPIAVAVFDRQRVLDGLVRELRDRDPMAAAQAAQSLVHLGDPRGIPTLIDELGAKESSRRALAYDTLKHYTQEDIPFDPDATIAARSEASGRWRQWWHINKTDFSVKVRAAQIDSEVFL
jgi:HEAT repeat protein